MLRPVIQLVRHCLHDLSFPVVRLITIGQVRQVMAQLLLARLPASPLWGAGGVRRQPSGGAPRLLPSLLLGL